MKNPQMGDTGISPFFPAPITPVIRANAFILDRIAFRVCEKYHSASQKNAP